MDGGRVNLDERQISHWRDDLLANGHSIQSTTAASTHLSAARNVTFVRCSGRRSPRWRLSEAA